MFFTLFTQPILNALMWLYGVLPVADMGLAIVVFTVLIKGILWPLNGKALRSQKAMKAIQPKIKALQAEYKDRPQEQAAAMMKLYKEEQVNPFSSCLPILIQIPVLLAIFNALRLVVGGQSADALYTFVTHPAQVDLITLGGMNLAETSLIIAVLTGVAQFVQSRMMSDIHPLSKRQKRLMDKANGMEEAKTATQDEDMAQTMARSMMYTMPIITVIAGVSIASGVVLYWFISTLMAVLQQGLVLGWKRSSAPSA